MLSVEHITTGYGKKQVLTDVSFEVGEREVVLLTGGNGSGKSTVLKTIYGLLKPWKVAQASSPVDSTYDAQARSPVLPLKEGRIVFDGKDVTALPTEAMIRRGIVYVPQKRNVFEDFTVEENLFTAASIYPRAEARRRAGRVFKTCWQCAVAPRLAELRRRTPFNLSGGEKQLLAFGCAFVHNPRLYLLDEPFAGVDDVNATKIGGLVTAMKAEASFVIVEHKRQALGGANAREIKLELGEVKK